MLRKILKVIFNRITLVGLLLCVQVAFFLVVLRRWSLLFPYVTAALSVISVLVVYYIVSRNDSPEFKLAWCIPILIFPVFGGFLYLVIKLQSYNEVRKIKKRYKRMPKKPLDTVFAEEIIDEIALESKSAARQARYVNANAAYPVYKGTRVKYLPIGEEFFSELLYRLKTAEKYIFMEYFIIGEGKMWGSVLEILEEKAKSGVDVRVMYDSMGSLLTLPPDYELTLNAKGIKCVQFNKFRPAMSSIQNNRDHRKICVIDGKTAFTGGINLADEYINEYERCGHWKDNGVMLEGRAVKSFTAMFLEMWNLSYPKADCGDVPEADFACAGDGYVMPYGDAPGDDERLCESVYLNLIGSANSYLYITTPYFIVGEEFITALELAAKGGVDVRIVTPHIWDKRFVHLATRSYYKRLIKAGVRVYEYTPGFIHAKTFVCDGTLATVGTANLDYRSMYLHYECGVWLYKCGCISAIKDDILDVMEKSHEITLEECENQHLAVRAVQGLLRPFTPLM